VVEGAVLWYMYVGWGYGYFEMMEGSGGAWAGSDLYVAWRWRLAKEVHWILLCDQM
jgi:hypothetical protein